MQSEGLLPKTVIRYDGESDFVSVTSSSFCPMHAAVEDVCAEICNDELAVHVTKPMISWMGYWIPQ